MAERDRLRAAAERPKSAAAGRPRRTQAEARRDALIDIVTASDPDEPLRGVLLELAKSGMTCDPDFPTPGEWLDGIEWFRGGLLQILGEPPNPDDTIVFRRGASHPFRGAFRWSSSECFVWI